MIMFRKINIYEELVKEKDKSLSLLDQATSLLQIESKRMKIF